ncbi:hypothetical protein GCM10023168_28640 [Fodinibacter luteus]|uniref:Uncharacterized protein n=1 Tax=Fodinibacter luteus TaxID=552064 RepID=A0ABP8KLX2_9MICO
MISMTAANTVTPTAVLLGSVAGWAFMVFSSKRVADSGASHILPGTGAPITPDTPPQ